MPERNNVPALDARLEERINVGPDGFVRLVDYMGSEASIVRAARVSYGSGTKTVREDRALIRYLVEHSHTSPLEQVVLTFHCRLPIYVARQWVRHRTARLNEYSGRYSEMIDSAEKVTEWRGQATTNKQGSVQGGIEYPDGFIPYEHLQDAEMANRISGDPQTYLSVRQSELQQYAREVYEERLAFGVAREMARNDLPLSTYTEWYWQMDLHNLLHFLSLRQDSHAQKEIREYADAIAEIVKDGYPNVWEAHLCFDVRKNAVKFSGDEAKALRWILGETTNIGAMLGDLGVDLGSERANEAFIVKLRKLVEPGVE